VIICAGKMESFGFATPVGIGLVDVAIELTMLCLQQKPKELIFIGSAGSYGRISLFEIIESCSAYNIENSFVEGNAYSPIENAVSSFDSVSRETLINSSNYITTNKIIAYKYIEREIDLENMEFYSVLKVAKRFGIPAKGIFVVTNYCDENAHEYFKKNHREAMLKLTDYIKQKAINLL